MKKLLNYFSKGEIVLWLASTLLIAVSFVIFDRENYLALVASLVGITSLILNAKGNPTGLILMIIFSGIYGYISYSYAYYGEMITYVGMSGPMSAIAFIAWLRNPYNGNHAEVKINQINAKEVIFMLMLSFVVTVIFYYILKYFNTANLIPSTLSVTTSFIAVYLTAKRSPYYALAYGANDIILIVLWILAVMEDISYISVIICFVAFLANDIYGFINWKKMMKRQSQSN